MPHDYCSNIKHLVAAVICVLLLGRVVSSDVASAQPTLTKPAQAPQSWSQPVPLSNLDQPVSSEHPDIAVCADGTVYVVWVQGDEIWYRVYDPSAGWNEAGPVQFQGMGITAKGGEPAIAVSSDCVLHLVWSKSWGGNSEVFYTFNDGNGFVGLPVVSNTPTQSFQPDIIVDSSGEPHVVWVELISGYEVYEGKWIPGLQRFGKAPIPGSKGQGPTLTVDGADLLHLTWMYADAPGSLAEIYYKWQEQKDEWPVWWYNVSDSRDSDSRLPSIAVGSDEAVIVWQETVDSDDEIYVRWRRLDSFKFKPVVNLSNSEATSRWPAVAADGLARFLVAWDEGTPVDAILTRPWRGSGNWEKIDRISVDGTNVKQPAIAASPKDSHIYAVWAQQDGLQDTWDIYFSQMETVTYRFYLVPIARQYAP